jgi:hypothetical protein
MIGVGQPLQVDLGALAEAVGEPCGVAAPCRGSAWIGREVGQYGRHGLHLDRDGLWQPYLGVQPDVGCLPSAGSQTPAGRGSAGSTTVAAARNADRKSPVRSRFATSSARPRTMDET